jgi:hypothetical protein
MTGLRFLFRVTLRRLDHAAEIYHLREPEKMQLVMSADETKRLLAEARLITSSNFVGRSAGRVPLSTLPAYTPPWGRAPLAADE